MLKNYILRQLEGLTEVSHTKANRATRTKFRFLLFLLSRVYVDFGKDRQPVVEKESLVIDGELRQYWIVVGIEIIRVTHVKLVQVREVKLVELWKL